MLFIVRLNSKKIGTRLFVHGCFCMFYRRLILAVHLITDVSVRGGETER